MPPGASLPITLSQRSNGRAETRFIEFVFEPDRRDWRSLSACFAVRTPGAGADDVFSSFLYLPPLDPAHPEAGPLPPRPVRMEDGTHGYATTIRANGALRIHLLFGWAEQWSGEPSALPPSLAGFWKPGLARPDQMPVAARLVAGFEEALVGYGYLGDTLVTVYDRAGVTALSLRTHSLFSPEQARFSPARAAVLATAGTPAQVLQQVGYRASPTALLASFARRADSPTLDLIYDREVAQGALVGSLIEEGWEEGEAKAKAYCELEERGEGEWSDLAPLVLMLRSDCDRCGRLFGDCECNE